MHTRFVPIRGPGVQMYANATVAPSWRPVIVNRARNGVEKGEIWCGCDIGVTDRSESKYHESLRYMECKVWGSSVNLTAHRGHAPLARILDVPLCAAVVTRCYCVLL